MNLKNCQRNNCTNAPFLDGGKIFEKRLDKLNKAWYTIGKKDKESPAGI